MPEPISLYELCPELAPTPEKDAANKARIKAELEEAAKAPFPHMAKFFLAYMEE